jgi:hypothetical protein
LSTTFAATFFADKAAAQKDQRQVTVETLFNLIRDTTAPAKAELPWIKLARFGNAVSEQGCLRHDRNVIAITGIEGDYDGERMRFDEAVEIAAKAGLRAIIYTSPSHAPERPRWRILCPTSRELPPRERAHMVARINGLYHGILSAESFALSQSYYYGSVNGNQHHRVEIVDGQSIDQLDELDLIAIGKPGTKAAGNGANGTWSGPVDEQALLEQILSGESYHTPAIRLLGRWARNGVSMIVAEKQLRDAFDGVFPPDRDARWQARVAEIPRLLEYVWGKEIEKPTPEVEPPPGDDPEVEPERAQASNGEKPNGASDWSEPPAITFLAGTHWLTRDIPEPDFLLGELLSTTSRLELIGPTGLGKTNLLTALGMAIADGRDFLPWRGCGSPRRVLYVDGEMSQRLAKKRLIDAARRHGGMPSGFFCLNREDAPDLQPLNTEKGQKFLDATIETIGGVDLLIFDNIQALLAADDDFGAATWRDVLPWLRNLTSRSIGQIWVHHTGHDETHGYGTKTQEWQLDTVALMERVERPELDIAFKLTFIKARERSPDNRADFEPAIITLANDRWASERGEHVRAKRTAPDRALELLRDAITREGQIPPASQHIPPNTRCVTEGLWRRYCEAGCISEGSTDPAKRADANRKAFKRATDKLIGQKVGKWELWVWVIRPDNCPDS